MEGVIIQLCIFFNFSICSHSPKLLMSGAEKGLKPTVSDKHMERLTVG